MTLDTIDEDTAGDPLIPAQARDVAAAIAEPKRQTVASACCGAELPTVFELRHRFARPGFPTGIGGPPFDRRSRIDFDPILPQADIDQLAYAHQQVLGLVGRGDEAAKKLFNMDTSKVLNRYIPPHERVIRDYS
ncbi:MULTISPECIES: hypothetical protein [unclassified Mesorhizobium]|uniref:hypothetical protein n=1 Tax=unclassified Mesorhizobium TaxID=325217 RepID=UPI001CCAAA77|nr:MULTISPECIES: hypothetical protein [unclassified Mesorhizobium]MBZ9742253.1 hypothetical protein [Mesorhizobium sp. CO1-1-4]MBZ9805836.1 hypothetical protein [Mesorhizobium sp. ES1-6]